VTVRPPGPLWGRQTMYMATVGIGAHAR
jgi:hypothetical protein